MRSHTRTVLSCEPLRMRWPSGIAATAVTKWVCPAQVLTRFLVATFHTLTRLSYEPLMMCWPSGVTATAITQLVCPLKVGRACSRRGTADLAANAAPDLAVRKPATKAARRAAATQFTVVIRCPPKKVRSRGVERPQLRELGGERAARACSASTATALTCLRAGTAVAPHLDGVVVRAGDDAAVGRHRHALHPVRAHAAASQPPRIAAPDRVRAATLTTSERRARDVRARAS